MALVTIPNSTLAWSTIGEWVSLCYSRGSIIRAASDHYAQMNLLHRSLTVTHIRTSHDLVGLDAARHLLGNARCHGTGLFQGPERSLSRAEIGALLVELHNRQDALRSGRWLMPRAKGPAFDPALLPDEALDRLIQRHPDLTVVDRLRAERQARQLAGC